jgi:hypothetical protein
VRSKKVIKAALDTLRDLDLGTYLLLGFAQEVLALYGCSDDATVRKAAALAAWRVVERQWGLLQYGFPVMPVVWFACSICSVCLFDLRYTLVKCTDKNLTK